MTGDVTLGGNLWLASGQALKWTGTGAYLRNQAGSGHLFMGWGGGDTFWLNGGNGEIFIGGNNYPGGPPLTITGASGQQGNILNVLNSGGQIAFGVDSNGYVNMFTPSDQGGIQLGSNYSYGRFRSHYDGGGSLVSLTGNWNSGGEVTPLYAEFRRNVVAIANSFAQYHLDVGGNLGDDNVASLGTFRVFDQTANGATIALIQAGAQQGSNDIFDVVSASGATKYFSVGATGNVGLGVTPASGTELAVNGVVKATEVMVTGSPGADYVFAPNYRLAPLTEVAGYIEANHHLPDVRSAKEVEENGVNLGDMQTRLLAKIEELTLHMIQMSEEVKELKRSNESLSRRIRSLQR